MITLFQNTDFQGSNQAFAKDKRDLAKTKVGDKPSSIEMTSSQDAVLLFKRPDWKGDVMYLRGPIKIADFGDLKGRRDAGFRNSITSLRQTPFRLDLNVSVVHKSGGKLPGYLRTRAFAESVIKKMISAANKFYRDHRALLELNLECLRFRESGKLFDIGGIEGWRFPGDWKQTGAIDVVFVNSFKKKEKVGWTRSPCWGKTVAVAGAVDLGSDNLNNLNVHSIGVTLVHEIGHYLGLSHNSALDDPTNLMYPEGDLDKTLSDFRLFTTQIEEMHTRLAKNISRKGDRHE